MRGEEVQAIGAIGRLPDDALICHPGTHSKWIVMRPAGSPISAR